MVGGLISAFIEAYVTYVVCRKGFELVTYYDPQNTTLEQGKDIMDDEKVRYIDVGKPLLEVWKGGADDPF